jgi:hypothetical protein
MKIRLYWILFLGQTIGDATIGDSYYSPVCCSRYSATRLNLSGLAEHYSSAKTVPDHKTAVTQLC